MNFDTSVLEYWKQRINSHLSDTYMGVPMLKLPEDLATYEYLMYEAKVNVVVELGTGCGGSAMWFRDRLMCMAMTGHINNYGVVTVDKVDRTTRLLANRRIAQIFGDVTDSLVYDQVESCIKSTDRVMVIEDTAHTYDTTYAALDLYSDLVSVGSYFVVEDTYIDNPKLRPDGLALDQSQLTLAIEQMLRDKDDFEIVPPRYGITTNPGGWLKRVK